MKIYLFALSILISSWSHAQKNQVCFTYDDLPVVSYGINDSVYLKDLTNKLVKRLNANKIPAIGFVNEIKVFAGGTRIKYQVGLLNTWVDNGLELGNHTFSHIDYNNATLEKYAAEIQRGEKVTGEILARKNMAVRYFRHPYLHTGNSKSKADSLSTFLANHKYTVAPVSIDNEDYVFAVVYHRTKVKGDRKLMEQIGHDYILYMEKKLKYYEKLSNDLFGRNISHILLLHANALNADYIDSLAAMYRKNNYEFVNLETALKDSAYKSEVTVFGNWGISWIDRWALSKGRKGDYFKDDPATPDYIVKLSQSR